ncbi:MAG: hypothetical protein JWR15_986, partial [Prosthecobacter sp.]|nr:hypothetical protein [Prosthecobacter sp.]
RQTVTSKDEVAAEIAHLMNSLHRD